MSLQLFWRWAHLAGLKNSMRLFGALLICRDELIWFLEMSGETNELWLKNPTLATGFEKKYQLFLYFDGIKWDMIKKRSLLTHDSRKYALDCLTQLSAVLREQGEAKNGRDRTPRPPGKHFNFRSKKLTTNQQSNIFFCLRHIRYLNTWNFWPPVQHRIYRHV